MPQDRHLSAPLLQPVACSGIRDNHLTLANRLQQKRAARECADWIADKVDIRTIRQANLLHGKMYHVASGGVEDAIVGSSNFTVAGLGLGASGNNIELNLLCDLFDARTKDGSDMAHYSGLLSKALASIEHTFQRRAAANLLASRSALLPSAAETPTRDGADFDLVTWLVIMSENT